MVADQPIVVYAKMKKDGPKKHTLEEMDNLYDMWMEKHGGDLKLVGEEFSLDDYLNNRI